MLSFNRCRLWAALLLLALVPGARAKAQETPLTLTLSGTITPGSVGLPWPADPALTLTLGVRLRAMVTSASTDSDVDPQIVEYFNATAPGDGFQLSDRNRVTALLSWSGRWTNRDGFLLEGAFAGQRVEANGETLRLSGTAEVRGLSGRGRGLVLRGPWTGQLDTRSGALRVELTGPAVGELGPPAIECGDYTDENLAGALQPLMLREDGSVNTDHFGGEDGYPHPFPYSTNPPTSGPHSPSPLPEGIYETPQNDEDLVHNLEHGHVLVTYHPSLAPAIVARLKAVVALYDSSVLLLPRPANDAPIALSSWGRLLKMTEYDEPAVQHFIDRNRGHGPECLN